MKKVFKYLLTAAVWLALWQTASMIAGLELLLPSPASAFNALCSLAKTKEYWLSVLFSLCRITAGYAMGIILGSALGLISYFSKTAGTFFSPMLHVIKATPVASFIILALVWLKTGVVPPFISMLIVMPFVWSNVRIGMEKTDAGLLEMARAFKVPFSARLKNIYMPAVKPYFISAASTAMGLAWKAGAAAEVICYPMYSIGRGIYNSKIYMETPQLFAWTATVIILSIALERIIVSISRLGRRTRNDKA